MSDVINEYHRWKEQGEELRVKAKQAMETRFRDLLLEALRVSEEYRADFGGTLKAPPAITAFRYKAGKVKKQRSAAAPKASKPAGRPAPVEKAAPVPTPQRTRKIAGLEKRLATARKKLEAAKAAGAPTRDLDDRVYELEDELKIATGA
jgi:hypothetical protein